MLVAWCLSAVMLGGAAQAADDPLHDIKLKVRAAFPDVPQLSVEEAFDRVLGPGQGGTRPLVLDVRDDDEFAVSHLQQARRASSIASALALLDGQPMDTPIVTYCSVGWRSSELAAELMRRGYTNVQNLEGSLFEWANRGLPVYRQSDRVCDVHPFNWRWGRFLNKPWRAYEPRDTDGHCLSSPSTPK